MVSDESIHAKIDNLDLSNKMKTKMHLVHDNFKGIKIGLPEYDTKEKSIISFLSIWAFLFNIIYYIVKGLWRKAIMLIAISFVLGCLFVLVETFLGIDIPESVYKVISIIPACIAMQSAYYDIYRKKVLGQKFWW